MPCVRETAPVRRCRRRRRRQCGSSQRCSKTAARAGVTRVLHASHTFSTTNISGACTELPSHLSSSSHIIRPHIQRRRHRTPAPATTSIRSIRTRVMIHSSSSALPHHNEVLLLLPLPRQPLPLLLHFPLFLIPRTNFPRIPPNSFLATPSSSPIFSFASVSRSHHRQLTPFALSLSHSDTSLLPPLSLMMGFFPFNRIVS